jgi:hypothetical protein
MSSSYRKVSLRVAVAVAGALGAAQAVGADAYFQPVIEVATEYNSNRDLVDDQSTSPLKQEVMGYHARIGGSAGIRTPRSDTRIQPRLILLEYPDRDDLERVNGSLSLRNTYRFQRSEWTTVASLSRQDRTTLQYLPAIVDDFDPDNPVLDDAGRVTPTPETITSFQIRPSFTHSMTQKLDFEFNGTWQTSSRDSDVAARNIDFDSWTAEAGFGWRVRPLTQVIFGGYATSYETSTGSNSTDGIGGLIEVSHQWTPRYGGVLSVRVERTEVDARLGNGTVIEAEETNTAISAGLARQNEISEWRLTVGRFFSPTNYGNRSNIDQVHLEYRRRLSALSELATGVRAVRTTAQGSAVFREDDRAYFGYDLQLRRNLSRNWFVKGEYGYVWQEYRFDDEAGSGAGHMVRLSVGYQGLAPQWVRPVR